MEKFIFLSSVLLLLLNTHKVEASSSIEAKFGYFFFTTSPMKSVYNQGGTDVQLSGAYPIASWQTGSVPSDLRVYASVEFFEKSGHSRSAHQKTCLWAIPVNAGLQTIFLISSAPQIHYYATLGPRYTYMDVTNQSQYVPRHMHGQGVGLFANTGFTFTFDNFLIDLFGEYSYAKIDFHPHRQGTYTPSVQISGVSVGLGIGYQF
jgi:hypothetical protein